MRDEATKFSAMTVSLHWLLAIAMISMLVFGLVLEDMPRGDAKSALMWWHKGLGVTILVFALWRFGWRMANGLPNLPGRRHGWQENAAIAAHWFLLLGTLFMPISGMMMSIGGGHPIDMFGLFTIGPFAKNDAISAPGHLVHGLGSKLLIAAIVLHIAGALKHHLFDRDATLKRMLGARVDGTTVADATMSTARR